MTAVCFPEPQPWTYNVPRPWSAHLLVEHLDIGADGDCGNRPAYASHYPINSDTAPTIWCDRCGQVVATGERAEVITSRFETIRSTTPTPARALEAAR